MSTGRAAWGAVVSETEAAGALLLSRFDDRPLARVGEDGLVRPLGVGGRGLEGLPRPSAVARGRIVHRGVLRHPQPGARLCADLNAFKNASR